MQCRHELERESRILLQIMLKHPHHIQKLPLNEVALYKEDLNVNVFVKKLALKIVHYMSDNGWLALLEDQYYFTQKGREWVAQFIYFLNLEDQPIEEPSPSSRADLTKFKPTHSIASRAQQVKHISDSEFGPLLKLFNRQRNIEHKYLSQEHLQAGQKLFGFFAKSKLQPNVTMNWERIASAPQPHYTGQQTQTGFAEATYMARKQLYEGLAHVGEEYAAILVEICLFGNGLEATEKSFNWPARSGKLMLTMALDKLVSYYGMDKKPANRNKYLSWAMSDFKAEI
ncbi:MAG: hypothetical protein HRU29_03320 [Rhizobiales bacterium]|nr:DUF6456 domain-containing protein [Hyphomicrobiales bacterium]NRB13409.1 hypothetical protein [Hyphomicrobiales bacterium]